MTEPTQDQQPQPFRFGETVRLTDVAQAGIRNGQKVHISIDDLSGDPGRLFTVQGEVNKGAVLLPGAEPVVHVTVSDQTLGRLRSIPRSLLQTVEPQNLTAV